MVTYTTEKLSDNLEAIKKLAELHYKEVAPYDDIPLCINWERFIKLEEMEVFKLFIVREEGELVGYASFMVYPSIEYSTSLQASLSNIFIHKYHRGKGAKFISWCDEQLKSYGVQVVYHHVKAKNDYGVLLKRLGYVTMNINYSKRLDK